MRWPARPNILRHRGRLEPREQGCWVGGLAGEVWPAPRGQERLKEAAKLGFSTALVPKANAPKKPIEGLTVHAIERIEQAVDIVRGL